MKEKLKQIIINILTWEARTVLRRHKPKVVAITGSLGKTGTKDAVAAALGAKYTVRKSPKSFNSEFGLPLTILGLPNAWNNPVKWIANILRGFGIALFGRRYEEVLVLEVGADKPGDIASVASWLKAEIVIITAIPEVPVHVEFYPTVEAVLQEKAQLIKVLKEGGVLITGTDEFVSTLENPIGETLRATYDTAEVMYESGAPAGMHFALGEYSLNMSDVLGEHQGLAPAFALATADKMGVDIPDALQALESMQVTPGRMRLLAGKNGSTIIDDSYNSSPTALKAALEALGELEVQKDSKAKKIAILGDMRELGEHSAAEHRRAGFQAAHIVDELYTIGEDAEKLAEAAISEGLSESAVHIYDTDKATDIGKELASKLNQGDVVLVKSSQGQLRLERAVKELMQESSKASELLVRQEPEWLRR